MPYLNQGEFYSEFGSFKVKLTLPKNYVVGATGTLQEIEEYNWLRNKATNDRATLAQRANTEELTNRYVAEDYPASAAKTKTITYTAKRVHDFAWFADKRFKVLHDTLQLAGQLEAIDVWAMFTETQAGLWINATDYLKRSTRFYSEQLGAYPYPQVTGLQSALSAGGGMEYPMITVIGQTSDAAELDAVLAHEVGHNWFYGILASNERDHAWMDEGLNSFYEKRYMATFWPDRPVGIGIFNRHIDINRLAYHYTARQGKDQAPDTPSDSLSSINYWISSYTKPSLALTQLEAQVSTQAFDKAMQAYFNKWKFKHPQPEDFFAVLHAELGSETTAWFSDAMLTVKTSDWVLKRRQPDLDGTLTIVHQGALPAPATAHLNPSSAAPPQTRTTLPQGFYGELADIKVDDEILISKAANPLDLYTFNNASRKQISFGLVTGQERGR